MKILWVGLIISAVCVAIIVYQKNVGQDSEPKVSESPVPVNTSVEDEVPANATNIIKSDEVNNIGLSLLAASVQDSKAVILTEAGDTQLVSIGDRVGRDEWVVLQIASQKIVLKGDSNDDLYFVYLKVADQASKVQKLSANVELELPLSDTQAFE